MKKTGSMVIALCLIVSCFSSIAQAAIKTGSKCKKAGNLTSSAGTNYICKQSGTSLTWVIQPSAKKSNAPKSNWTDPLVGTKCDEENKRVPNQIYELRCLKKSEVDKNSKDSTLYWYQNFPSSSATKDSNSSNKEVDKNSQKLIRVSAKPRSEFTFQEGSVGVSSEECKLKDSRIKKTQLNNVGFPLSPDLLPATGVMKLIFIPVDFSDAVGTPKSMELFQKQVKKLQKWYTDYSRNKLKIEVITTDKKWYRAAKPASEYKTGKGRPYEANPFASEWNAIMQEFMNLPGDDFNYDGVGGVFFMFPENIKTGITEALHDRGFNLFTTPQGAKKLHAFAFGQLEYDTQRKFKDPFSRFWSGWIHELLHSQGISLHAPGNGWYTSLASNGWGDSSVLGAWETWLLGWLEDSQVHCVPLAANSSAQFLLEPIEIPSSRSQLAVIPLNEFEGIAIESRRSIGYSSDWKSDENGLFVYLIDTRKDNDRSNEGREDSGNDEKYSKWAYFLLPNGNADGSNEGATAHRQYLVVTGNFVKFRDYKITLTKSDNSRDLVKVERF
jgi:hypothetical protein